VKVLKVETIDEDREGVAWFKLRVAFRDSEARVYHVSSDCVTVNADSPVSCDKYLMPRPGTYIDVVDYGDVTMQFSEQSTYYRITSIEIEDCRLK
jgi:hypothetical protein